MGKSVQSLATCPELVGDVKIVRELGRGATSVVYEGEREGTGYAVKILTASTFEKEIKQRFYREAGILARIHHPNLVRTHKVSRPDEEPPYIVMDLVRGQSLAIVLKGGPLDEQKTLSIASEIVSALSVVHRNGLVHRDLKPQNIMLDESGAIKLIDFGLAEDNFLKQDKLAVVGTLLYTAPEQSGVLNREVDSRSDLYSLGIILYECLTGAPPYVAADAAELINLHLSSPIPNVRHAKKEISERAAAMIARLMAKDPDDRYKSTDALLADLNDLLNVKSRTEKSEFSSDLSKAGELTLAGRKSEFDLMNLAFQRTRAGKGQVFIVEGEPGSGKSRLVRDVIREAQLAASPVVLFAKANSSQSLPFGHLREAIDRYLNTVAALPDEKRRAVYDKIKNTLAERAALLKHFSPHLKTLFSDLPDNSVQSTRPELFFNALVDLVTCLGSINEPLIFFIDDLQWIDDSSRQVIKRISARIEALPIFMLATIRSNTGAEQDLGRSFANSSKPNFARVVLGPLDIFSTKQMVLDYLGCRDTDDETVRQIFSRSSGNPFAVQQFLIALVYNGLLTPSWGKWELNASGLESLELPNDVIQLLLKRSDKLRPEAKQVLQYAAALSDSFDLHTLVQISGLGASAVSSAIHTAIGMNLLEPDGKDEYRFIHDRVMEAFGSIWSDTERAAVHGKIANYFHDHFAMDQQTLFKIGRHYAQSSIADNAERVFTICQQAARAALDNHAIEEALSFLNSAQKAVESNLPLRSAEFEELFGVCALRAKMFKESEDHFRQALMLTSDRTTRARIFGKISWISNVKGEKNEAWHCMDKAFAELGVRPLKKNFLFILSVLFNWARTILIDKFVGTLQPPAEKNLVEKLKTLVEMSTNAGLLGFYDLKGDLMALSALRSSIWARKLGVSKELVFAYSDFSALAGMFRLKGPAEWYSERAIECAKALQDPTALANAQAYWAFSAYFQGQDDHVIESRYRQVIPFAMKWAEPSVAIALIGGFTQRLIRRGLVNEAEKFLKMGVETFDSEQFKMEMQIKLVAVYAMQGKIAQASTLYKSIETYLEAESKFSMKAMQTLASAMFALEQGDFGEFADKVIENCKAAGFGKASHPDFARSFLTPCAHIRLGQWMRSEGANRSRRFVELKSALKDLKKRGSGGLYRCKPEPLTRAHIAFIEAAIHGENGEAAKAQQLLDEAEIYAVKTDCQWILFDTYRYRARLFARNGFTIPADRCAKFAMQIAIEQGWSMRRASIQDEFNLRDASTIAVAPFAPTLTQRAGGDDASAMFMQRQLDALLKYNIASSKVFNLRDHCEVALQEIVRLLNPERAMLFVFEKKSENIQMQIGRDSSGQRITELSNYSKSIVEKVRTTLSPILLTGSDRDVDLLTESILAYDLRSIVAAPLLAMGELIGVIYLDSSVAKGIFKESDVRLLLAFGSHIAVAIDSARATQLELEKSKLQKDLEVVGAVQSLLLPKINQTTVGRIEAYGYYQTATQSGGDWWWFDQTPQGKFRVLLGDVTGHGAGSAMVTAVVASCYHTVKQMIKDAPIEEIIYYLNKILLQFSEQKYWMTLSVVEFDQIRNELDWWSAGAPSTLITASGRVEEFFNRSSMPLGSGELKLATAKHSFLPGDQMMMFSDGLYEFRTGANSTFGLRSLMRLYSRSQEIEPLAGQMNHIISEVSKKRWTKELEDDVTIAIVKYQKD